MVVTCFTYGEGFCKGCPPPPRCELLSAYQIQISLRSSTILYFSTDCPNCAKFPSLKCANISLWLNPNVVRHSQFHNTSNHPPPATDSGRTARTPLYPPAQAVPTPLFFFLSRTWEQAKDGTCAHDRLALQ